MPISLEDAIERADIMAGDDGLLSPHSYDLLVSQLAEEDVHPFTMALVERGVRTKFGAKAEPSEDVEDISDRLVKVSRLAVGQVVNTLAPMEPEEEGEPTESLDVSDGEISRIRDILESVGLSVSREGMVTFYQTGVPGIYTEKLPQMLPLETAARFWEQKLNISDREKARIDGFQDILSRLYAQVSERSQTNRIPKINEINETLSELENYGYEPRSKSKETQAISGGIEEVFDNVMSSNWMGAVTAIRDVQGLLEVYGQEQLDRYESDLEVWDALDKLNEMKENEPERFEQAIGHFGGLAARLLAKWKKAQMHTKDPGDEPEPTSIELNIGKNVIEGILKEFVGKFADLEEAITARGDTIEEAVNKIIQRTETFEEEIVESWRSFYDEEPMVGEATVFFDDKNDIDGGITDERGKHSPLTPGEKKEIFKLLEGPVQWLAEEIYLEDGENVTSGVV